MNLHLPLHRALADVRLRAIDIEQAYDKTVGYEAFVEACHKLSKTLLCLLTEEWPQDQLSVDAFMQEFLEVSYGTYGFTELGFLKFIPQEDINRRVRAICTRLTQLDALFMTQPSCKYIRNIATATKELCRKRLFGQEVVPVVPVASTQSLTARRSNHVRQ